MCASIGEDQPHPYYILRLGNVGQCLKFIQLRGVSYLLVGGLKGELWLVSTATKRPLWTNITHGSGAILYVDEITEGTAITYGKDQFLCVWSITEERGELIQSIKQEQYTFCNFTTLLLSEGCCLACMPTSEYSNIRVLKIHSKYTSSSEETILKSVGKAKECTALKVVDRNTDIIVLAAYLEDSLIVWSLTSRTVLFFLENLLSDKICTMDFDETRMMGVIGGTEGSLGVFRIKKREGEDVLLHDVIDYNLNSTVSFVRVRRDRKLVTCGTSSGIVYAISWKTMKPLVQLKYHEESVYQMDYSVEGSDNIIAVCSKDKRISLWKLY
ncbi:Guanine nucleotide-binding protein subunit beta-like protein 1 [Oopsacas minuta]|uniref:Guanine nucleotide-binding protein subunit beta-like protein 1 n=1 Tax=Oopsacas minuta TaxID=111878 RepID=A0AAV7JB39_9METZ|nr:Guanine nucleotide-binding protein subunit beta-like protein 1 [Oopsacas minuta]